ncbi:MAG TPA: putative sulfate exporter family transporter [Steroidobacteraceae bacterium]|nr:putative sulfate exporter family transporter [Steroidobacteraceae bacterium]
MPGLALVIALAIGAKLVSLATGGQVSAILCAVLLGVLWRNLAGIGGWADPGIHFARYKLLRIGIALIGLRLTLALLAKVSLIAVPIVIACVAIALIAGVALGRLFGVSAGIQRLLAAGTAICGCTAIIAVAPIIKAREQDIGISIACVVLFGSVAMVGYPWIAHAVFGHDVAAAGLFFGASIQDTSQVVGAAMIYAQQFDAPDAVAVAGLTKFLRTFGLLVLVPVAAMWMARIEATGDSTHATGLRRSALPAFVIAFIVLVGVRTAGDAWLDGPGWQALLGYAQQASELLLLCGMAAVGLGITFAHLLEAGWRPLAVAFLAATATGATALVLLHL